MKSDRQACMDMPTLTEACGFEVRRWRACGLGCRRAFAYCDEHGGEARAERECVAHHAQKHGGGL